MTPAEAQDRMAAAYEAMAAGTFAGRTDGEYCEIQAERARSEAEELRKIVPLRRAVQDG